MEPVLDPLGPMTDLVRAVERRDLAGLAGALADDVRLAVPPLGLARAGRDDAARLIGELLRAFPDLTYRARGRYVAPGEVTDEAVLEGTSRAALFGRPPIGRPVTCPARVQIAHDGTAITAITLWPDVATLRDVLDLGDPLPGTSSALVTALRATLPAAEGKVIVALGRDLSASPRSMPSPAPHHPRPGPRPDLRLDPRAGAGGGPARGAGLRVPVPRRVRRMRAAALGTVMLAASSFLVAWVARGSVGTALGGAAVRTGTSGSVAPVTASRTPPSRRAVPTASPPVTFRNNQFDISSDFLFGDNEAVLAPGARATLIKIAQRIRREHRWGVITVTGYTDIRGTSAHNRRLSQRRAEVVAAVLRQELAGLPQITVVARGRGEVDRFGDNATKAGQAANRRVTVKVPLPAR